MLVILRQRVICSSPTWKHVSVVRSQFRRNGIANHGPTAAPAKLVLVSAPDEHCRDRATVAPT